MAARSFGGPSQRRGEVAVTAPHPEAEMMRRPPFSRSNRPSSLGRWPTLIALALLMALAPNLAACSSDDDGVGDDIDDMGVAGPFEDIEPLGKADSAGVPGPAYHNNTSATQVWYARNDWEDTDTPAARKAGMAWPADSGLSWDQKYQRWIESMTRTAGYNTYFETFTLTTPWNGKTLPAPKLECAELAIFLRVTFAAWYNLPFYMTSVDSEGTRVYFGHFGAWTKTHRYKNTPKYAYWYHDYSDMAPADYTANWPRDETLRERGLWSGGDEMEFLEPGAVAGTYFYEIHLNKRAGHFLRLILSYFGSMHLASSRNMYNLKPEAVLEGDVVVKRYKRQGIGHTLVVKRVDALQGGQLEAEVASGSMPRRQPNWESPTASKSYFTAQAAGGPGTNYEGDEYAKLGGGLKRWRVTKNINGYWTNTWMNADEASWISDTDYDAISARPARFEQILGEASPEQMRDAVLEMVEAKRNHLREYPASCSARIGREEAFEMLYEVMEDHFGMTKAQVDAQYRILEDYVFAELVYEQSKTCCWNSSTTAMHQIALEYNESLQADQCSNEVVPFMNDNGYDVFRQYAEQTGRGHLWKPWSADEHCPQADVAVDTPKENDIIPWCDTSAAGGGGGGPVGCQDDGFEENDSSSAASALSGGTHSGLMVCAGDDDYYEITVPGGLSVTIQFDHDEGDLDMELLDGSNSIDSSTSISDSETVTAPNGGTYTVRVYGYNGAEAPYSMTATVN
jgi:hypothetical protein